MNTFLEGAGAIVSACTMTVLVPAGALVLVARKARLRVALFYVVSAALLAWARAAGHWRVELDGVVAPLAAALAATAFALAHRGKESASLAVSGSGVIAGALAGWLWRPCVGSRLGDVLNDAAAAPARSLALMTVYLTGVLLSALLLALTPHAVPRAAAVLDKAPAAAVGGVVGAAYAVTLAVGYYDDLIAELYRIASGA